MSLSMTSRLALLGALCLPGCMTPPSDLDLALSRLTEEGKYRVTLLAPAVPAATNQMHSWTVMVATPGGAPVGDARIAISGGMPQHGHGLPTQPLVRTQVEPGTYLMEGMKFSMTGWWEIKLAVDSAAGADKVVFNAVVREPTAAR